MPDKRRLYWDTSLFISLIQDEPSRGRVVAGLLEDARKGALEIVTSTWTRAEVRRDREGPALTEAQHQRVSAYFEHEYIVFVMLDRMTAEEAARLGERYGLKPGDAVYLASALRARADVLHAWDGDFFNARLIADPPRGLLIEHPTWGGQLPLLSPESPTDDPVDD